MKYFINENSSVKWDDSATGKILHPCANQLSIICRVSLTVICFVKDPAIALYLNLRTFFFLSLCINFEVLVLIIFLIFVYKFKKYIYNYRQANFLAFTTSRKKKKEIDQLINTTSTVLPISPWIIPIVNVSQNVWF